MRRWGAVLVGMVMLGSYPACSSFGEEEEQPTPTPANEAGVDTGADPPPPEGCTPVYKRDFAGCICSNEGEIRDCDHGSTGGASACVKGAQKCAGQKWTTCDGANDPQPERCFNDLDDNCDGIVDNGCRGTESFELCNVDAPLAAFKPIVSLDKPNYLAGDDVHFFVLSTKSIGSVHLRRKTPSYCAGGAGGGKNVSPGKACALKGWKAYRRTITASDPLFVNGTTTIEVMVNPPSGTPCNNTGTEAIVEIDVVVAK